jgi:hypothetical protein
VISKNKGEKISMKKALVFVVMFAFALVQSQFSTTYAEEKIKSIDGFQNIKFGMSQEQVRKTQIGRNQKVELFGYICEVQFDYRTLEDGVDPIDLQGIAIDLTNCDEKTYNKIFEMIISKYELAYVPSERIEEIFNKKLKYYGEDKLLIPTLFYGFAGNQVGIFFDNTDNTIILIYMFVPRAKVMTDAMAEKERRAKIPGFIENLINPKKTSKKDL